MFAVDGLILATGVFLLLGIASSKLSARLGVPVLVLFLLLGMLAGSDGVGGIEFDNYALAHGIGTIALAMILFDGGLCTAVDSARRVWKPSLTLATLGVLITAVVTGLAASWILGTSLLTGLLLGSIVASTDAAAVFAVLRTGGVSLSHRVESTLEVESASNDPMAIFLTIACLELLLGQAAWGLDLVWLFVNQMVVGAVAGVVVGYLSVKIVNRVNLNTAGLYPVLVTAFGLLAFGMAAAFGGSGFLSVYLAGLVIGNSRLVFQRGIRLFHNATAWLAQIIMFVVLGLLSFPSRLPDVSLQGLFIAAVLMFLSRPLAVVVSLLPFRFPWREQLFISWVGLKGAVPITLATFPLLYAAPNAILFFDVVFFVVVLSAIVQGWSLAPLARWLGIDVPPQTASPVTLEISSLRDVEGDIVDYTVGAGSRAAGRLVKDLALPEGVVLALIVRGEQIFPPHGSSQIEPDDHVIVVLRPEARMLVDHVFAGAPQRHLPREPAFEFPLRGTTTAGELEDMYGIEMNSPREATLDSALRRRLAEHVELGDLVWFGQVGLRVRRISPQGTIEQVGMIFGAEPTSQPTDKPAASSGRKPAPPA